MNIVICILLLITLLSISLNSTAERFNVSNSNNETDTKIKKVLDNYFNFLDNYFENMYYLKDISSKIFNQSTDNSNSNNNILSKITNNHKYQLILIKNKLNEINYSNKEIYDCNTPNNKTGVDLLTKNLYCKINIIINELKTINDNYISLYNSESNNEMQSLKDLLKNIKFNYQNIMQKNNKSINTINEKLTELSSTIDSIKFKDKIKNELKQNQLKIDKNLKLLFNEDTNIFNILNKLLNNFSLGDTQKINNNFKILIQNLKDFKISRNNTLETYNSVNSFLNQENINKHKLDDIHENYEIKSKFCKKLKLLNKPSHENIRNRMYLIQTLEKKQDFVEFLEDKIKTLHREITDLKLDEYNKHKLVTHDQASKQMDAINKTKEKLKNANSVKLNIT